MHYEPARPQVELNPYEIPVEGKSETDMETPEAIEMEMNVTRQSLSEKVAALESQVVGTLQESTAAVQDTVAAVQDTVGSLKTAVEDTVGSVKDAVQTSVTSAADTIKSAFDVTHHVRRNPWLMVGGAVAAGFAAGYLLAKGRRREQYYSQPPSSLYYEPQSRSMMPSPSAFANSAPYSQHPAPSSSQPSSSYSHQDSSRSGESQGSGIFSHVSGMISQVLDSFGDEARKLAESAMTTAAASLKQSINSTLPNLIDSAVTGLEEKVYSNRGESPKNGVRHENRFANANDRNRTPCV